MEDQPATDFRLLVLSDSSDSFGLGAYMPFLLDNILPDNTHVHWFGGVSAPAPDLPRPSRLRFTLHASSDLKTLIAQCRYALVQESIGLFECLTAELATVIFASSANNNKSMRLLQDADVAVIQDGPIPAAFATQRLMMDKRLAARLSGNARSRMQTQWFAGAIANLGN